MDKKRDSPLSKWTREKARAEARKQDARYAKMLDSFDLKRTMRHPAVKSPRAIVSVAFSKEEFEQVSDAADKGSVPLSQFIRDSALMFAWLRKPRNPNETANPDAIVTTNG